MQSELDEEQKLSEAKKEAAEEHPPISAEQDLQNKKASKSQKQSKKKHQKQEKSQSAEKTVELAENWFEHIDITSSSFIIKSLN